MACLRCKRDRDIRTRGLCNSCYTSEFKRGKHADYPLGVHKNARLTVDQVSKIRTSREPVAVLAARYGVSDVTIYSIRHRLTWKRF